MHARRVLAGMWVVALIGVATVACAESDPSQGDEGSGAAPSVADVETTVTTAPPCEDSGLERRFDDDPYYPGPMIDAHFHMPQMMRVPEHPGAPVLGEDVAPEDVACLFDPDRVQTAFAFYSVPVHLRERALDFVREIDDGYQGRITPFLEFVTFPGHPVAPDAVAEILEAEDDLFDGYGELSFYLDFYHQSATPDDPTLRKLYDVAREHDLIVMMHPAADQQDATEAVLRDYPDVTFLFHGLEEVPWGTEFLDTFPNEYPNAYYSVDIVLFGNAIFRATEKDAFVDQFTAAWESTLQTDVSRWKERIEANPDRYLWGTDRGAFLWHYDPEIGSLLEEFSRAFIGQLDPAAQEAYAHGNAEKLLDERVT